ncbi:FadR/GntR family transcriptional regulator [Ectobacillus sp. sgz5001026]|uniref:FadR/GntR family transcriptional regulator n=1 Tax=Ectobacillus sp. sgz5001026 TaxID=3242473 RepID=UPI0036D2417B
MVYKSIRPKKIYEEVSDALLAMIKDGTLKPGDQLLPVHQLAEEFQVGRSAVREALSALRAMGLIEMRQGEGTYVKIFDAASMTKTFPSALLMNKQDIINLFEVRKVLEVGVARAAALRRTDADMQEMKHWVDEMLHSQGNEVVGEKADFQFHMAIASASHNPILVELMNHVSSTIAEAIGETRRLLLYGEHTTAETLAQEHQSIFESIVNGDGEKAQQRMFEHLTDVENMIFSMRNL